MGSARELVLAQVAASVCALDLGHPTRVAVDGITAAGKTSLAAELAEAVEHLGRPAATVTMDGYHHQRARRYRQGRRSAAGYFEDAFDCSALVTHVLVPLGPSGDHRYRARIHDLVSDCLIDEPPITAPVDAVIIVDGCFLQRQELAPHWDFRIFVDSPFETARARGIQRDAELFGGVPLAEELYEVRYEPACRLYLESAQPMRTADVIVDNDDLERPGLRRRGKDGPHRPV